MIVYMIARNGDYSAIGEYYDKKFIVKKGSTIRVSFAEHIRGGKRSKFYREDATIVDNNGVVLRDCQFSSPSTAAQFVAGCSLNGYLCWHVDSKVSLRKHLNQIKVSSNGE